MSKSAENRNHVERDRTARALRELKEKAFTGRLPRPYLLPEGGETVVRLRICRCGPGRRGPEGGVCWCGGAIPTDRELWGPGAAR